METKIYSSSGFIHQCSNEELYVLTRHWLSDIVFFERELAFFQSLLQRCFSAEVTLVEAKFRDLQTRLELLKEGVNLHQSTLGTALDKTGTPEPVDFNIIQSKLECELFDFIKTFRFIKQELFKFTPKCLIPNQNT
jgi:hypothetical protein